MRGRSAFLAAAMMAMATVGPSVNASVKALPARIVSEIKEHRSNFSGGGGAKSSWRRKGPGWTVRQVKRMAEKRRNKQRYRAAVKSSRGR